MEIRALRESDLEQAWALDHDAFHVPAERKAQFLQFADPARWIGAFDSGRLVAATAAHAFGQFFGRRSVPMAGVHSMSVVPDRRGQGLAREVMLRLLREMREHGAVISSLFPAATQLYRSLGYELGGSYLWRGIAPRSLQRLERPASVSLRPGGAADLAKLRPCYAKFAAAQNGQVDRSDLWWRRLAALWEERSVFVAEGKGGEVEGFLVYRQLDGDWSALGGPFRIAVFELPAVTRDAALALWRLLGSWATQTSQIVYRGPAEDPLLLLLPEQEISVLAEIRWMTRVVDARGAVAARGFARAGRPRRARAGRQRRPRARDRSLLLALHRLGVGRGAAARGAPGGWERGRARRAELRLLRPHPLDGGRVLAINPRRSGSTRRRRRRAARRARRRTRRAADPRRAARG